MGCFHLSFSDLLYTTDTIANNDGCKINVILCYVSCPGQIFLAYCLFSAVLIIDSKYLDCSIPLIDYGVAPFCRVIHTNRVNNVFPSSSVSRLTQVKPGLLHNKKLPPLQFQAQGAVKGHKRSSQLQGLPSK